MWEEGKQKKRNPLRNWLQFMDCRVRHNLETKPQQRNAWRVCHIIDTIGHLPFKYASQVFGSPWFTSMIFQVDQGAGVQCPQTHTFWLVMDILEHRSFNLNKMYKIRTLPKPLKAPKLEPMKKPKFSGISNQFSLYLSSTLGCRTTIFTIIHGM